MSLETALAGGKTPGVSPDVYSHADFQAIADLVHAEAGIVLPPGKAMLVYSRIAPLVRESTSATFRDYIDQIRNDDHMRKRSIDALTTNHTFFYREAHHFHHLAETARPMLLDRLRSGNPLRFWSAGCSSGEETWSLVVTLLGEDIQEGKLLAQSDVLILATDLAAHVLRKAKAASYAETEVKDVPATLRKNWLKAEDGTIQPGPEARDMVRFRELNLLGEWPMQNQFDIIFCRNVMIYFDQPTKERLVARFADRLRPGGFLYIGHSERVTGPATELLDTVGPTIYRRRPR